MCKIASVDYIDDSSFNPKKLVNNNKLHLNKRSLISLIVFSCIILLLYLNDMSMKAQLIWIVYTAASN